MPESNLTDAQRAKIRAVGKDHAALASELTDKAIAAFRAAQAAHSRNERDTGAIASDLEEAHTLYRRASSAWSTAAAAAAETLGIDNLYKTTREAALTTSRGALDTFILSEAERLEREAHR